MIDFLIETIIKGGYIILFIFLVNIFAWYMIINKWLFLRRELKDIDIFSYNIQFYFRSETSSALFGFLSKQKKYISKIIRDIISIDKDKIDYTYLLEKKIEYYSILESDLGTINTIAKVAPLMGLLGTVTGMMKTFDIIEMFGNANPVLMADGISEALLTTQAGLIVAFPILLMSTWLKNKTRKIKEDFETILLEIKY